MDIVYEYKFNINDVDEMMHVYHSNGWEGHTQEDIITIFNMSTHVIIAKQDGNVVGFARALSDDVFNAAIYDVVVDVKYQSQGIGKNIMELMIKRLGELSCIHLISMYSSEKFYESLGFRKLKTGMVMYSNKKLKTEYTV
ncbi:GNAT family N-acetyltransferase [Staphylococcus succinus]|uniref:GNAT family N-acetyltransferase n=1 Tax=Staphylococcus succinus TaxID=61015 RepID=UPI000E677CCC|nr:GNAT family N-acetyltransferase [Staphylococcus succinus]RIN28114.1 N-acetyltransferase [Staphylococcus succinus]RIN45377.1 N-acetyltransferase [Staphylococcus succinus]